MWPPYTGIDMDPGKGYHHPSHNRLPGEGSVFQCEHIPGIVGFLGSCLATLCVLADDNRATMKAWKWRDDYISKETKV